MRRPTRDTTVSRNPAELSRLDAIELKALIRQPGLSAADHAHIRDALDNLRKTRPTIAGIFIPSGTIPVSDTVPDTLVAPKADFTNGILKPAQVSALFKELTALPDRIEGGKLHFVTDSVLDKLRGALPDALPKQPLTSGQRGADLPLPSNALTQLLQLAAVELCQGNETVIWDDGINELTVFTGKIRGVPGQGSIRVNIPVACDQARSVMQIPFATGGPERAAGMIMATTDRPAGDPTIAGIWGEALIALPR